MIFKIPPFALQNANGIAVAEPIGNKLSKRTLFLKELSMKPIILFIDSRDMGGIESHVLNLALALKKQHHLVEVIFWRCYQSQAKHNFGLQHHPIWPLLLAEGIPVKSVQGSISTLLKCVPKGAIVHSHGYKANLLNKLLCSIGRWHALPTHHNGDLGKGLLRIYVACDELSSKLFHPISVSAPIYQRLAYGGSLITNFVTLPERDALERPSQSANQIAFVGRISPEKNAEGFCLLSQYLDGQQLHIYGEGVEKELLSKQYSQHYWYGQQNMAEHWSKIDLLVMPSLEEGLPLAALEAMAHGIPVCAFAVGDLPALIRDGVNGWLIPKGDLKAMANRICQWQSLGDQEKLKIRKQSQAIIKIHYSVEAVLPAITNIYQQVSLKPSLLG
ncbi:hypothetical protein BTE48_10615 [Oceanospirillum multiglobuliferum]|uniref:Uncharacterized protein n=2 Tax=Oceanospirillum multiglobuliferum TaxID=64969 RepID=A0A1V4T3E6_9GAMM|nr:hypothetical protein BTE48_10615 [Oceanospirillum multiglobuliferum]